MEDSTETGCVTRAGCWCLRALARLLLLSVTMSIQFYFFYMFAIKHTQMMVENDPLGFKQTETFSWLTLVLFLQFMSVLSLVQLFYSNPGFVSDYFKSKEVENPEGDESSRSSGRIVQYDIYKKEDYDNI